MANATSLDAAPTARTGAFPGVLLMLGSCMSVLAAVLLTPVLPIMQKVYATSPVPPALVLSAPALFVAIFSPFAGQIVDRLGRRRLLLGAMLLYAVLGTAPAWLPEAAVSSAIFPLLGLRLLVGVCEAAIMTCCTTLIGDYYQGQRRNRFYALQTVFTTIAATVFIALGGAIVGSDDSRWRMPFWVYGLSLLIVIPMFWAVKEPRRTAEDATAGEPTGARIPWRRIALPVVVTLFGGVVFFVLLAESSLIYSGLGVASTQTIGIISAGASIATALGSIAFTRLMRFGAKALLPAELGLLAVGLLLMWAGFGAGSLALAIVGAVVGSFGSGLLLPTLLVWAVGAVRFDERGRTTGVWQGAFFLGQFLSPIIVQALQGAIGGSAALAGAMGVIGGACAVVAVVLAFVVRPAALGVAEAVAEG